MAVRPKTVVFPNTVLVVDDEEVVLQLLRELFSTRGMQVLTADTGERAVELIERTGIGCLLTDKNLPGVDGIEVIRKARALQPYCACIVMTAYSSTESAVEALRLGAMDYLEKPFEDLDLVAEKVDRAILNQRAQFEREELLKLIRQYDEQLNRQDADAGKRQSELEMFERVMEARIREATDDLRRKTRILDTYLRETRGKLEDLQGGAKVVLEEVRGLELEPGRKDRLLGRLEEMIQIDPTPTPVP